MAGNFRRTSCSTAVLIPKHSENKTKSLRQAAGIQRHWEKKERERRGLRQIISSSLLFTWKPYLVVADLRWWSITYREASPLQVMSRDQR